MRKTENIINRTGINKTECKKTGHSKENKIPGVKCTPKIELYLSNFRGALHWWNGSLFFLIIILGITLGIFAGCKNIFVPDPPATPEAAGPGGGVKVTLRLFTGSARMVMPDIEQLDWNITAEQGTDSISATGTYPTYTLELPTTGPWTFTVKGTKENKELFTGTVTENVSNSTTSISIPLSPGNGMAEGSGATGKLNLTIKRQNVNLMSLNYRIDGSKDWGSPVNFGEGDYTITYESLPVGRHTLDLYFSSNSDKGEFYFCTVAVNIWPGMTSDQWVKTNGEEYITDGGEFVITKEMVNEFVKTMGSVVFVNESVGENTPATGSIFAPVNSVSKAVDILRKANPGGNYSGTIMVSGATTIGKEIEVKNGETLTVKGTRENASITNDKGRVFKIASGGSLTLEENITLTGKNDAGNGGAVYVNGGTFTMKADSKITRSSASYGGGVYVDSKGIFTMDGGAITKNSASIDDTGTGGSGGGVCISDGTFTMSKGAVISGNSATGSGGGVFVSGSGKFTMEGGTIGGFDGDSSNSAQNGGGVYIFEGTFTMSGGAVISGNSATSSGGGVYVGGDSLGTSTFTMSNSAVISGNSATSSGGGVYVYETGEFTMEGGTIGGSDGASANSSESGGGVCVYKGDFTMSDGSISGNIATDSGGGVFVQDGTFDMKGSAVIQGNKATSTDSHACGGGVYVNGGNFTMSGEATIQGNNASTTHTGSAAGGGGVYVAGGTFTVSGSSLTITGNTAHNVYLASGNTITIGDDGLTGGTIGVTTATSPAAGTGVQITDRAVDGAESIFIPDAEGCIIMPKEDAVYLADSSSFEVSWDRGSGVQYGSFADAILALNTPGSGGTIILQQDIDGTNGVFGASNNQPITFSGGMENNPVILDLNGHTIDRALETAQEDGTVISVSGALMLKDSTGSGKITGGNNNNRMTSGTWGGGVCVQGGALFTMEGGNISNNLSEIGGGGVYVCNGGSFTMTGGTIGGSDVNDANKDKIGGGGVFVNGEFTMSGGTITGNITGANGGGVAVTADGTFTMSGTAVISANKALNGSGGGVYVFGNFTMTGGTIGGTEPNTAVLGGGVYVGTDNFTLGSSSTGSSPVISGNEETDTSPNNVYLYNGKTLSITGKLEKTGASENIGITMANPGVFTSGWSTSGSTEPTFFFSDDTSYKIKLDSGECELVTNDSEVEYEVSGSTKSGTFAEAVADVNTAAGGTITLLKDIDGNNAVFKDASSQSQPITFSGGTETSPITLDLNGYTINRGLSTATAVPDGSVIKMNGGVLTIKDSSVASDGTNGTGTITGGNSITYGGGICIENSGSLTLESGSITGNKTGGNGGGVYFSSNGTFTMSGGSIKSNVASNETNSGNGGGVCLKGGTFTMSGTATIADNKAVGGSSMGGGIYLEEGTLTMTGNAAITGNQASATNACGGGIYLNSGTFNMIDGEITGNIAGRRGGGVYFLYKADDGPIFNLGDSVNPDTGTDPVIRNNTNNSGKPNNVYVESGALIEIAGDLLENGEIETEKNIGISKQDNMGDFAKRNGHDLSYNDIFSSDQDGCIVDERDGKFNISAY